MLSVVVDNIFSFMTSGEADAHGEVSDGCIMTDVFEG